MLVSVLDAAEEQKGLLKESIGKVNDMINVYVFYYSDHAS